MLLQQEIYINIPCQIYPTTTVPAGDLIAKYTIFGGTQSISH